MKKILVFLFLSFLTLLNAQSGHEPKLLEWKIETYQPAYYNSEILLLVFGEEGILAYSGLEVQGQRQRWQEYPSFIKSFLQENQEDARWILYELYELFDTDKEILSTEAPLGVSLSYLWQGSDGNIYEETFSHISLKNEDELEAYKDLVGGITEKLAGHIFFDSLYRRYD